MGDRSLIRAAGRPGGLVKNGTGEAVTTGYPETFRQNIIEIPNTDITILVALLEIRQDLTGTSC